MVNDFIRDISFHTGISESKIKTFLFMPNNNYIDYYKKASVPKKNGGKRIVYMPTPELKKIQYYLREKYFSLYPIHDSATAYRSNKSVRDNALVHRNNSSFLFIDVHDFFNSIDFDLLVEKMLQLDSNILGKHDLTIALLLASHKREFVQGCVTSPMLSNIFMNDVDKEIVEIVERLPYGRYSRYSDDMTISSSKEIPVEILKEIEKILFKNKLEINRKKTHFSSNIDNVIITGVRIKRNGSVSLSTQFKKDLKTRIYHKLKFKNNSNEDASILLGLLNYLKMIDPQYFNRINSKFISEDGLTCCERLKRLIADEKTKNRN